MFTKNYLYCLLVFVLFACSKKDAEPAKSSAKSITSFAFNSLNPAVKASIDSVQHTIKATLPFGADASKLVPTITISSKATVSPASGIVQDFTKPVTYTVTAEDGSSQSYVITINVATFIRNEGTLLICDEKKLYSINANAFINNKNWSFNIGTNNISSPTVSKGIVYVGGGDGLYAIDLVTGQQKWTFKTISRINSSPIVVNDIVYFGGNDANLYAIDAITGQQKWAYKTKASITSSPTLFNNIVYISSFDGNLYAIDAITGSKKWESNINNLYDTGISLTSSPAINNGIIYIGSTDSNLYAIDASTGVKKWTFKTGRPVVSSPTINNGIVYFGSNDANLYALDAITGTKKWAFKGGSFFSSPIVSNGIVYISGLDVKIYAIDAVTGKQQWVKDPGVSSGVYSSSVVYNNVLYVGSNSNLTALNALIGDNGRSSDILLSLENYILSSPCFITTSGKVYNSGVSGEYQ